MTTADAAVTRLGINGDRRVTRVRRHIYKSDVDGGMNIANLVAFVYFGWLIDYFIISE